MWCLDTLKQLNAKHAEMGRKNGSVNAKQVYAECGISVLGSATDKNETNPTDKREGLFVWSCGCKTNFAGNVVEECRTSQW